MSAFGTNTPPRRTVPKSARAFSNEWTKTPAAWVKVLQCKPCAVG
jgi:hypothetical protein